MAIPKLRFKEFDEDWSSSKIGKIFQVTSGATPLRSNRIFFENANIPWVKTTDLNNSFITHTEEQISEIALKKTSVKMLPKGTVFVAMYGGFNQIGRTGLLLNDSTCNQALSAIYPNIKIDSFFLLSYLNHNIEGWKVFAASSRKDPNITKSDVLAFPIIYPSKEEQTKIASFLSAVDDRIAQLTQEHELLTQYKKGMMQQLFSQKLRFKADDGNNFKDWEERKLGDVCNLINGRAYKKSEWEKEGVPVIRLQNLTGSGKEYYYSNLTLPSHQYCHEGDLLYMWSATFGPVFWQGKKAIFHYHIWKMKVKSLVMDKKYMYYLLDEMTEEMKKRLNGSTMLHVTKAGMEETVKTIPSLSEQTKIANFLSAIDQKIDNVAGQIDQAKVWKKGLLQQMFV